MSSKYHIVIRVPNFNEGKNKYVTAISEEQLSVFCDAVNSEADFALVNGVRLKTKDPELVKIFKVKTEYENWTDFDIKDKLRVDALTFFNGKLNIRILAKNGIEVTGKYLHSRSSKQVSDQWRIIHPVVKSVSQEKFEDQYYADAVESAFKEINDLIKKEAVKKGQHELDGANLMRTVFSAKAPIFKLADNLTESGRNIQSGYMDIFAGSMQGIRNPKAHANLDISQEDAWEKIVLASHLMKMWDNRINENEKSPQTP